MVETAADEEGRYWAYATLNDSFTPPRRSTAENRSSGWARSPAGTTTRAQLHTVEYRCAQPLGNAGVHRGKAPDDPRGDRLSADFDPFYVNIPFFYHQNYPAGMMARSFLENGYRGSYEFSPSEEYRIHFRGGQYTEYIFAGPDMPAILTAYTWLTGRTAPPPAVVLGYHQLPLVHLHPGRCGRIAAEHRAYDVPCDSLWLDIEYMDGYRVFTWDAERFRPVRDAGQPGHIQGFRVIDHRPRVDSSFRYEVFDAGLERDVFCRTEDGDDVPRAGLAGNTAFPDFVTEEGRTWWGELNAAHVRSGLAGIWNDMNEPPPGTSASSMRFGRGAYSTSGF